MVRVTIDRITVCVAEPAAGCVAIVKRINVLLLNIQKTKTMASGPITS